jgi:hypothetical protein
MMYKLSFSELSCLLKVCKSEAVIQMMSFVESNNVIVKHYTYIVHDILNEHVIC